jgi:hypothetical protein
MAAKRKSIDCRDYPSEKNCSLKISAHKKKCPMQRCSMPSQHGHEETPELREQIESMLKDEPN